MEKARGQKMVVMLENISNVNQRTLRKSVCSKKTIRKVEEGSKNAILERLNKAGYSEQECNEFISNHPKSLYAGLIYDSGIPGKMEFPLTIEFAARIDDISLSLFTAKEHDDLEGFKQILLESDLLDRKYYVGADEEWTSGFDPEALTSIKSALDWGSIDKPFAILIFNTLFSLMAHWDIEFYSQYFYGFEPRALFSLVLPKLVPAAGDLSEATIAKRRGMFWLPVKRLIDLMACLGYFKNKKKWPDNLLKVSEIVTMIELIGKNVAEQELINWRDGTKRFMQSNLDSELWPALCPDKIVPYPLFVAATMWQTYFVEMNVGKKVKKMLIFDDRYQWWWKAHSSQLASDFDLSSDNKDLWPKCFDSI